ncbi:MAG: hypothetical protein ACXVAX_03795 [Pseudobdellovibrio sp.]
MKKIALVSFLLMIGFSSVGAAKESRFCAGFYTGYKAIKGDMVIPPLCPVVLKIPALDSDDFTEGIKAGVKAASN